VIPRLHGRFGEARVSLGRLPCRGCGIAGHTKRYVTPDFGPGLIGALYFTGSMAISRQGAWRRPACRTCGSVLAGDAQRPTTAHGHLVVEGMLEFDIEVRAPGVVCSSCGTEQVLATDQMCSDINEAMIDAFRSVRLRPRGY
jgi:hypothetical protein